MNKNVQHNFSADVVWYRETMRLDPNGKRYMESRGSKHTLIVRKIEKEDFANYSCYATNTLGRAKAFVYLRGKLLTFSEEIKCGT